MLHKQAENHKSSKKKHGEWKCFSSFCFWLEWIFGRSFILCRIYSKCKEQHCVRRRTFKCDSFFFRLDSRDGNNGKLFETNVFCVVVVFFLFLVARSVCCCSNLLLHFTFLKLVECFSKCHSQLLR